MFFSPVFFDCFFKQLKGILSVSLANWKLFSFVKSLTNKDTTRISESFSCLFNWKEHAEVLSKQLQSKKVRLFLPEDASFWDFWPVLALYPKKINKDSMYIWFRLHCFVHPFAQTKNACCSHLWHCKRNEQPLFKIETMESIKLNAQKPRGHRCFRGKTWNFLNVSQWWRTIPL